MARIFLREAVVSLVLATAAWAGPPPPSSPPAEMDVVPGEPSFLDAPSPDGRWAVHFEDDRDSAWLTAVDPQRKEGQALHAVRIWLSDGKRQKGLRHIDIRWSRDRAVAGILVDGLLTAVLDFDRLKAWARPEQPIGTGPWGDVTWSQEAEDALCK
jgi:hypothetical protein